MKTDAENELLQIGAQWLLTAMGKTVYVATKLKPGVLFPIGVARLGQVRTELFVRPVALQPIARTQAPLGNAFLQVIPQETRLKGSFRRVSSL